MSAVTERPKLDVLRAKEAELAIEVDTVRARIAEYPELLHDARSRAIYARPNVRPGAELNGEVAKITARERKDVAALNALEGDPSAVRSVIAEEAARVTEEETAAARALTQELHAKEEAIWEKAGAAFAEIAGVWNSYVEQVQEAQQFASANRLENSGALAVTPRPGSFREWLLLLLEASTAEDVRSEPHTEQLVDSGIYGRRDENGHDIGGCFL